MVYGCLVFFYYLCDTRIKIMNEKLCSSLYGLLFP